jgi:RHS repeat-associated protein
VFDSAGNRIAEYNQATGALIREYIWLDNAPIAVVEGGVIYSVRTDHIGRAVFATNAAGAKVWTASYLPFGGLRVSTGVPLALRFPGQWFQSESGLHQNWMRDYDPTTGRYLQADPLGLVDGASVYGYARQSPAMVTDPTGQCPWCVVGVVFGLQMLYDYLSDEDCYTLGDFATSAATNNPYNPFRWAKWVKNTYKAYNWIGHNSGGGRGSNNLFPDTSATGEHSTYRQDSNGNVTTYETWKPNPQNPTGFDSVRRVDTQYSKGASHYNKVTGIEIPVPHVHDSTIPGGIGPAGPGDLPP